MHIFQIINFFSLEIVFSSDFFLFSFFVFVSTECLKRYYFFDAHELNFTQRTSNSKNKSLYPVCISVYASHSDIFRFLFIRIAGLFFRCLSQCGKKTGKTTTENVDTKKTKKLIKIERGKLSNFQLLHKNTYIKN